MKPLYSTFILFYFFAKKSFANTKEWKYKILVVIKLVQYCIPSLSFKDYLIRNLKDFLKLRDRIQFPLSSYYRLEKSRIGQIYCGTLPFRLFLLIHSASPDNANKIGAGKYLYLHIFTKIPIASTCLHGNTIEISSPVHLPLQKRYVYLPRLFPHKIESRILRG
jgi:hypothetical protein